MKIFFNQVVKNAPWGGGNSFLIKMIELLRNEGHQITFKLKKKIDLIFIVSNFKALDPRIFQYHKRYPTTKILHRINECDKRKDTNYVDDLINQSNQIADKTIFISNWLADYFIKKGFTKEYKVIYNGCDTSIFYPYEEKTLDDIFKLVTHHWSSNWMKGFDIYTKLDEYLDKRDDISFTYIGNPKNTKVIQPKNGIALGNELRNHDAYITASRWEPCGMHHIEGASCGLPVLFHEDGGGINESCKNYGIEYSDIDSCIRAIELMKKRYFQLRDQIPYEYLSAKRCCSEYYELILDLFNDS